MTFRTRWNLLGALVDLLCRDRRRYLDIVWLVFVVFFLRSELDAEVEAFEGEYDEMQAEAEASEYGTMEGQISTRETLGVDELAILSEAIYRFKFTTI